MSEDGDTIVDPPRDEDADRMVGRTLGERYRIDAVLGSGGFSVVYRARHLALGRDVAVKVVQTEHELAQAVLPRFEREAQALASLHHPGIVTVTDYGVADGVPYLVMELAGGDTLRDLLARSEVDPVRALGIIRQILRALHYAHGRGVVHRDLKPENVLVARLEDDTDHVQVLDFGFAKFLEHAERAGEPALTQKGTAFGTPSYVAPESLAERPVDGRADVYAAGVILFEMLAGRAPFVGEAIDILRAHLGKPPPLLAQLCPKLSIAADVDPVIQLALAKSPDDRFASAQAMIVALDPIGASIGAPSSPSRAPPPQSSIPTDVIRTVPDTKKSRGIGGTIAIGLFLVGMGAIVIALAAALILWINRNNQREVPRTRVVAIRTPAAPSTGSAPGLGPIDDERPPARDPWAEPLPPNLSALKSAVDQHTRLDQEQMNVLFSHIRQHPEDCRAHLILSYAYVNVRWLSAAVRRYERAYEADPACRGDDRMLRELAELSRNPTVGSQARRVFERVYRETP